MARDRLISSRERPGDEPVDFALRPQRLGDMVGQGAVLEKLDIAMAAARQRGEPLEHILLDGPPGLGKTTLANVIARFRPHLLHANSLAMARLAGPGRFARAAAALRLARWLGFRVRVRLVRRPAGSALVLVASPRAVVAPAAVPAPVAAPALVPGLAALSFLPLCWVFSSASAAGAVVFGWRPSRRSPCVAVASFASFAAAAAFARRVSRRALLRRVVPGGRAWSVSVPVAPPVRSLPRWVLAPVRAFVAGPLALSPSRC